MKRRPRTEERKGVWVECGAGRIQPDGIVDARKERLSGKSQSAAVCVSGVEGAGTEVSFLRGKQAGFEVDDLLLLVRCEIASALRVSSCGVIGLVCQVFENRGRWRRFSAVPHHRGEKAQVR